MSGTTTLAQALKASLVWRRGWGKREDADFGGHMDPVLASDTVWPIRAEPPLPGRARIQSAPGAAIVSWNCEATWP